MPRQLDHKAIASAVLLDAHRFVEEASDEAINRMSGPPVMRPTKPPNENDARRAAKVPPHIHAAVLAAAAELGSGAPLPHPPTEEGRLTDEELAALGALKLVPAARTAVLKIVRSAASAPSFHFLCLLIAVGDPDWSADESLITIP